VDAVFNSLQSRSDTLWITHAGAIRAVALPARGLRHPVQAAQWPLDTTNYGQWRTLALLIG
jgi:alpha-ribazole phosphatase